MTPLAAWPDVTSTYILARDDRTLAAEYCRRIARQRLHVTTLEIDGGHSPFLSRPAELADLLLAVTAADSH